MIAVTFSRSTLSEELSVYRAVCLPRRYSQGTWKFRNTAVHVLSFMYHMYSLLVWWGGVGGGWPPRRNVDVPILARRLVPL